MTKQIIKLTESDLHKIINESVNKIINEDKLSGDLAAREIAKLLLNLDEKSAYRVAYEILWIVSLAASGHYKGKSFDETSKNVIHLIKRGLS